MVALSHYCCRTTLQCHCHVSQFVVFSHCLGLWFAIFVCSEFNVLTLLVNFHKGCPLQTVTNDFPEIFKGFIDVQMTINSKMVVSIYCNILEWHVVSLAFKV